MILYRAYPTIFEPGTRVEVTVKLAFVFRGDPNHDGDIEHDVFFRVNSTDPHHQHWRLVFIKWRHCGLPEPTGTPPRDEDWQYPESDPVEWYTEDISDGQSYMKHFKIFVGENKHGLYPNADDCEHCYHNEYGLFSEDCSEGWEGLARYGIGGFDFDLTGDNGFRHPEAVAQYAGLTDLQKLYLGNVGEAWLDTGVNLEDTAATHVADPLYIFMPTQRSHAYWSVHGRSGDLGGYAGYPLTEISPSAGDWGVPGTWFHNYDNEFVWAADQGFFCGGWPRTTCPGTQVPFGIEQDGTAWTVNKSVGWETDRIEQIIAANPIYAANFDTSCRLPDSDWDGIPDEYDCDPHNPYLTLDTDRDGVCDQQIFNGTELACQIKCSEALTGIQSGIISAKPTWSFPVCIRNCTSIAPPDNCVQLGDPDCAAVESTIEPLNPSWLSAVSMCAYRYGNPGCSNVDPLNLATATCEQTDTDGDGVGDLCQHHTSPPVVVARSPRGITIGSIGTNGLLEPMSCRRHEATIDFDARGVQWREGFLRPTTVGVCACDQLQSIPLCQAFRCLPEASYADHGYDFDFPYAPVTGCNHLGDSEFSSLMTQAGYPFFKTYHDLCRFKDVAYRPWFDQQHVAIDWPWPRQNTFSSPDLEDTSYPANYPPDPKELRDRHTVVRVEYPQPAAGSGLLDGSWYPDPATGHFVSSGFLPSDTFDDSNTDRSCFKAPELYYFDLPGSYGSFVPGVPSSDDPLLARRPGSWVMLEDPLAGDYATMTLSSGALEPSAIRLVTTESGVMPRLDQPIFAGGVADTRQLALSHAAESVVFAYAPGGGGESEQPEPPDLYLGLVDRESNRWLSWAELFGPGVTVPRVQDPQIFFSRPQNAVYLLGSTADASGIVRPNTLVRMSLADGSASRRRLDWLGELADHTSAYDSALGWLVTVGGSRTSTWSEQPSAVSEVWIYNLGTGGHFRLPPSRLAQARTRPGLILDGRHRRALVAGGYDSGGIAQTDAWAIDLITGQWTFLGDGATVLPQDPGARRPFVMYDPRRDRLWTSPAKAQLLGYRLDVYELDIGLGVFEAQRVLSNPTLDDQIRDGREAIRAFEADPAAPYGQLYRARVVSSEPHLRLAVQDGRGNTINESLAGAGEPTVAWAAVPGEIYRLVVDTAPGYPRNQSASFQLLVEQAQPVDVGSYATDWSVQDVTIAGQRAFVSAQEGIEAVSLADPLAPARLSRLPLGNKGRGAAAVGRWLAYVRGPGNNGLKIIDAIDPTQMTLMGEAFSSAVTYDVALKGRTAYLAQGPFGVGVVDFTVPTSPVPVQTLASTDKTLAVLVYERTLYVAQRDREVHMYRITSSGLVEGGSVPTSEVPVALRLHGSKLLVAEMDHVQANKCYSAAAKCSQPTTVEVLDLADPASPIYEVTLPYSQVQAWFGRHLGELMLIPDESGFTVRRAEAQP